jgi:Glycosyl hydrolases family 38 N-terminal domain
VTRAGSLSTRVALPESLIPEEPRRELLAGVAGTELELAGMSLRAGAVPLVRHDGRQAVRIATTSSVERELSLSAGPDTTTIAVRPGLQQAHLFVPPGTFELRAESGGEVRRAQIEIRPRRPWRVFVVHHSHLDIGYTDPQARVLRNHLAYLDSALDYAADDAEFRWTIESNIVLERWLAARPPALQEEMLRLLREGRFEACALPFTLHVEAASIDELARQLRFADVLRGRGVEVVSAMQTDVPGAPPGLPRVLAAAGVHALAVAHNPAGRARPWLTGGADLPRAFRWHDVTTWHTDGAHGVAYLEGNLLGLAESFELVEQLLPDYLLALETRGWPYSGSLGVPVPRAPYPHDALHLRVQGTIADNAAPSPLPARIARAWNERYAVPKLVVATNREFFEELPGELPQFEGDWGDWWADGLGSAARAIGFHRRAQAAVRKAQTIGTLAGRPVDPERVYERLALFDEHTWGAAHPDGDAAEGRGSGALQWQSKAALATESLGEAEALVEAASAAFRGVERIDSILVVNPSGFARTDLVTVLLPEARPLAVVDVETQSRVPHAFGPPEAARNRPRGVPLSFLARDVPALGYRRFELVRDLSAAEVVDDAFQFEVDDGVVTSLRDEHRRELIDQDSAFGFAQIVHDRYLSELNATLRASGIRADGMEAGDSAVRVSRTVVDMRVVDRVSTAVEERVTLRGNWAETTLRLVHGVARVDIAVRLTKPPTHKKESVFVVFPFALDEAAVRYELTGGIGGGARVPGGAEHMHAIRHWVELDDLAWATLEAPLVQLGNIFLPYPPYPETIDRAGGGFVASWVTNNVWDTNFPRAQGGEARFSYCVAVDSGIATADALTRPLVGVLGATREPPVGALCGVDAPGVEVVLVEPGPIVHLQSCVDSPVEARVGTARVTVPPQAYLTVRA